MTRNFELLRHILTKIEETPASDFPIQSLPFEEPLPSNEDIAEHIELLIDAGLIEGDVIDRRGPGFIIKRMTWAGHDFTAAAKNDKIWNKVMKESRSKGLALTIDIIKELLIQAAKTMAGL